MPVRSLQAGAHDGDGDAAVTIGDRFRPLDENLDEELAEGGREIDKELREKQRALVDALPLDQ